MNPKILMTALLIISTFSYAHARVMPVNSPAVVLPDQYFRIMDIGIQRLQNRLSELPDGSLSAIEAAPGWRHFPSSILIPAVLYSKEHPANQHYHDQGMLILAERIGDILAKEDQQGLFTPRQDSDWDTYMWLEAYRLLQPRLGSLRRKMWREALLKNLSMLEPMLRKCIDYPWYNAPFITTSPNHYAIYASTLLVAGEVFDRKEWKDMAIKVLHRFVTEEQAPDGYWGEHSQAGPTTGYDYLTETQIALYREYSDDPDALKALRRSTDFHKYFTYPDGTPVETINDRNRYWGVPMWGHFGFSNFPDGRRYAAFLTGFSSPENDIESISRVAQDALYYHEGEMEPIPQDQDNYVHQMSIPAGIRKTGPWVVCLSGLMAPEDALNNFFLDRQGNLSIFHKDHGLIICGANSKNQPDLATFVESVGGKIIHMPVSSRLKMDDIADRLALAYLTFFSVIEIPAPTRDQIDFRFVTTYKWGDAVSKLNLQIVLKAGMLLETGSGKKIMLGSENITLGERDLGGTISHNGWILHVPGGAELKWPVYPFNPYGNGAETGLTHAMGVLSFTLKPEDQVFSFVLQAD